MNALISVSDKTGIVELAQGLHAAGWRIISSGGTASAVSVAGVPVTDVAELTGLPAILDHRVVTLHPRVHGGLLADPTNPAHRADMAAHGIEPIDLVVCDASFIPLHLVLAAPLHLARPGAHLVALIKPQFEVGRGRVGKGGIVRDPDLHREVCDTIVGWLGEQPGWRVLGVTDSPIEGADGNREFLVAAQYRP